MHLRSDSTWIVPEPELVLLVNRHAKIIGYTIGNDLSCRDIEGENPLYLPQAKTFNRCAALGPSRMAGGMPTLRASCSATTQSQVPNTCEYDGPAAFSLNKVPLAGS
jgi:fumarylacetoacetate (FAA) hydrolase family protein